jgi:hypothetical protein
MSDIDDFVLLGILLTAICWVVPAWLMIELLESWFCIVDGQCSSFWLTV